MKKCNGYFQVCKYKGTPIVTLSDENGKKMEELCVDCCKAYLKKHPKLSDEIKGTMKAAIHITDLIN